MTKDEVERRGWTFYEMAMSYWVYILQSETSGRYYIGQADDLARRLARNNNNEFVCILCWPP